MPENRNQNKNKTSKPKRSSLKKYAALSGIGFQMGAIIFLFAWAGRSLDARYKTEKEWFTIGFVLLGVGLSIYFVIKQLQILNKKFDD